MTSSGSGTISGAIGPACVWRDGAPSRARCVVLVGVEGIEPSTDRLKGDCSTAELHPECAVLAGTGGIEPPTCHLEGDCSTPTELRPEAGAEGRVRTGDTTLFRRVLYQLSYPGESTIG